MGRNRVLALSVDRLNFKVQLFTSFVQCLAVFKVASPSRLVAFALRTTMQTVDGIDPRDRPDLWSRGRTRRHPQNQRVTQKIRRKSLLRSIFWTPRIGSKQNGLQTGAGRLSTSMQSRQAYSSFPAFDASEMFPYKAFLGVKNRL